MTETEIQALQRYLADQRLRLDNVGTLARADHRGEVRFDGSDDAFTRRAIFAARIEWKADKRQTRSKSTPAPQRAPRRRTPTQRASAVCKGCGKQTGSRLVRVSQMNGGRRVRSAWWHHECRDQALGRARSDGTQAGTPVGLRTTVIA